ncbi:Uncharacterised protein [Klebsiella pneumoniae]|uniref:Uncharacterized protein n=1 Tax=Klebsiella pneumoniae TaxID=573 RepID=A0A2X3IY50_KLEPN|nr:Uncharacterised protein [Klebsiella pneumoniae]
MQRLQIAFAQIKALFRPAPRCCAPQGFHPPARESWAASARVRSSTREPAGRRKPGRLPRVMVPVLSSSRTSTSPAASTAAAAGGDHVGAEHTAHPGDADGRQQPADGGRDQAHQQGDQYGNADRIAAPRREGPDGGGGQQEHQRQGDQQDRQGRSRSAFYGAGRLPPWRSSGRGRFLPGSRCSGSPASRRECVSRRSPRQNRPPDSRITGADSPVMALSSTEAPPSMTSPSQGIISPASTSTTSPLRRSSAGT